MPTHATIVAFDICVLLSVLPSWYSMMTAWLIYSLTYGLLVGKQETPDQPPLALCLTQTLLIGGVPVLVVSATLNLYIELYFILQELRSGDFGSPKRWRSFWLVITPWLIFITMIIEVLLFIFPGGRLNLVRRAITTNFYCHLQDSWLPSTITAVTVAITIAIMVPLEVWLGFTMYRSSNELKRLAEADHQLFIGVYARLALATFIALLAFGLSLTAVLSKDKSARNIAFPIVACAITIVFASQKDILRAWLFWRPSRPSSVIIFRVNRSHDSGHEASLRNIGEGNAGHGRTGVNG